MIGTLDDLAYLLKKAHEKGLYVFMFGNVGYGKFNADYFKKACKDYALGVDSKERNWFLYSRCTIYLCVFCDWILVSRYGSACST